MVSTDDLAWTYCFHHLMACDNRLRILPQNIHNHVRTRLYGVLIQPHYETSPVLSTSNHVPKIIKSSDVDGNVTLGKLNCIISVHLFALYLISHTFSTNCAHCFITCLKKMKKQNIFNINTHFTSGPHMMSFKLLLPLYHTKT
jgi:hypothetical protein